MTNFFGQGICLIEWAKLIREILPEKRISVTIEKDLDKGFDVPPDHHRGRLKKGRDNHENIRSG